MKPKNSEFVKRQESITKFYQSLGGNICDSRKRSGLTQEMLADQLSISRVSMTNIESGKQRLPLHLVSKIAEVLRTRLDSLIPVFNEDFTPEKKTAQIDKSKVKLKCMDCSSEFGYNALISLKKRLRCPECGSVHYAIESYRNP